MNSIQLLRIIFIVFFSLYSNSNVSCEVLEKGGIEQIKTLRDSLESVQYSIPQLPIVNKWTRKEIRTQGEFDRLKEIIEEYLESGVCNLEICLTGRSEKGRQLVMPIKPQSLVGLNYPLANIRIVCKGARIIPEGLDLYRSNGETSVMKPGFWIIDCGKYCIDDLVLNASGNEIPFREEIKQVIGDIENVPNEGKNVWRFYVDLPDLARNDCKDFYVLLTRDWTSARHKVLKVEHGWLYYHLESTDYGSLRNPNVDWIQYRVRPRYMFINNPEGEGLHINKGLLYVPWKYKKLRIHKGGILIHMANCKLNSVEIKGFKFLGLPQCPISAVQCLFYSGFFVHDNEFKLLSMPAINTAWCDNVFVFNNRIENTRWNAIVCSGNNTGVYNNLLSRIGWMLNTRAIIGGGDKLHICDNVIEDFNYGAIACGSRAANRDSVILNYIIERNTIRLSKTFTDDYLKNTLADGGGIYIGPSCTRGIIRNNVVIGIKGINSNRGIFLDDGAKNLAIYGNLIANSENSYDIDLRYSNEFGNDIPDYNSHNSVFNNILTGSYRFQDNGVGSNCFCGKNILLGIGKWKRMDVKLHCETLEDIRLEGGSFVGKKLIIPREFIDSLKMINVDNFVKEFIMLK